MTAESPPFLSRPDLVGSFGMSASTHWLASATSQSVLERGGTAFDAAVAAGFVLHVVEPHLNGPGGDLVGLVAPAGSRPRVLMGQGPAPRGATIAGYRERGLELAPGAGALAAAVPGAVDAWLLLLRDLGTWEVADVLAYAIHYARTGHPVLHGEAVTLRNVATLFREHWPTSAELWLPGDRVPEPGDILVNHAYADTLERLAEAAAGPDREARVDAVRSAWREGFVAETVSRFVADVPHRHSDGEVHRGVLDGEDMAAFQADWEEPVTGTFRGADVLKAGAWCQGPALLQALAILDGFTDEELDPATAGGVHRIAEALKLALADRDAHYGDGMAPELLEELLSPPYAASRRELIGERASAEFRPGVVGGSAGYRPPLTAVGGARDATAGEPTVSAAGVQRGDTCHLDVVDRHGNIVSITPSGGWLQSSPVIPGLGFALGTRLQMTWLDPQSPAALRPGRRPRTTLTPTLVRKGEDVVTALGSPGGDQQDQWQALYLIQTLSAGRTPQEAIEAPAFHTTSFPNSFWPREWTPGGLSVEDRIGEPVIRELEARGHRVTRAGDWSLGRLSAVTRDPATGLLGAAANPRGAQGYAAGR